MALVDINWKPSPRQLREFGWAGSILLLTLAAGFYFRWDGLLPAIPILVLAAGLGTVASLRPRFLRPVYIGTLVASSPIAWLGSYVILAVIYFGVFSIVALIFRLLGRDALQRRFQPQATSYWQPKRMSGDLRQYLKQF